MDDQIYLVPGEPYLPGDQEDVEPARGRRGVLGLAGLLALAMVAFGVQHSRTAHPPTPIAAPPPPVAAAAPAEYQPWPQGIGVCGSKLELTQASWVRPVEPTGTTVPAVGALPALVNVDTGQRSAIGGLRLRTDQYVSTVIQSGPVSYVLVRNCQRRWAATVLRVQAGQPQRVVSGDRTIYRLIGDDTGGAWAEAYTGPTKISPAAALGTTLVRLDRPAPAVELPQALNVIGLSGDQVVATAPGPTGPMTQERLYRYDLPTRKAQLIGLAYSATESRGVVLWTSAPCSATGACPLHSYDLRTGRLGLRNFHLPLGSSVTGGVLSPDGHRLAFALERELPDLYYRSDSSRNPSDLVVLDLRTGILDPVPDLELPPGSEPDAIRFSADSTWLIVALRGDGGVDDIYSWRPGMTVPQFTPRPLEWQWAGLTEKQVLPQ